MSSSLVGRKSQAWLLLSSDVVAQGALLNVARGSNYMNQIDFLHLILLIALSLSGQIKCDALTEFSVSCSFNLNAARVGRWSNGDFYYEGGHSRCCHGLHKMFFDTGPAPPLPAAWVPGWRGQHPPSSASIICAASPHDVWHQIMQRKRRQHRSSFPSWITHKNKQQWNLLLLLFPNNFKCSERLYCTVQYQIRIYGSSCKLRLPP